MMTRELFTVNALKSQPFLHVKWFCSGLLKSLRFIPDNDLQVEITK